MICKKDNLCQETAAELPKRLAEFIGIKNVHLNSPVCLVDQVCNKYLIINLNLLQLKIYFRKMMILWKLKHTVDKYGAVNML